MLDEMKRKEILQSTDQIISALDKVSDSETDVKAIIEKELEICTDMAYACRISEETEKSLMERLHTIERGSV